MIPVRTNLPWMGDVLLRVVQCRCCGCFFHVCRSCWRGQAYCGERCRRIRQRQLHRKAQGKYRNSKKGKERRRLYEKTKKSKKNGLNPGDDSSTPQKDCDIEPKKRSGNRPSCLFCGSIGVVVDHFPRRAYAGRVFSDVTGFEKTPYP